MAGKALGQLTLTSQGRNNSSVTRAFLCTSLKCIFHHAFSVACQLPVLVCYAAVRVVFFISHWPIRHSVFSPFKRHILLFVHVCVVCVCVCVCVVCCMCMSVVCVCVHAFVVDVFVVCSLLPCGSEKLNSGHQARPPEPLPAEPSHQHSAFSIHHFEQWIQT